MTRLRRCLLLLMLCALPLRLWAGDAVGIAMALQAGAGTAAAVAVADDGMPADCPMRALMQSSASAELPGDAGGSACSTCQLCAPIGQWQVGAVPGASAAAERVVTTPAQAWASAALAGPLRPPRA